MNSPDLPAVPRWATAVSAALSLLGLVGLVLTVLVGFETPNTALSIVSGALVVATPMVVVWHFAATRTLTTAEKRVWLRELTGAGALSAMSEDMTSPDLRASARRRADARKSRPR
jgi:hypothetical protein